MRETKKELRPVGRPRFDPIVEGVGFKGGFSESGVSLQLQHRWQKLGVVSSVSHAWMSQIRDTPSQVERLSTEGVRQRLEEVSVLKPFLRGYIREIEDFFNARGVRFEIATIREIRDYDTGDRGLITIVVNIDYTDTEEYIEFVEGLMTNLERVDRDLEDEYGEEIEMIKGEVVVLPERMRE